MLYCPRCEYEFANGELICPDCQVALVERKTVSGAAGLPDSSWVRVWGMRSNSRAEKAKRALDTHNIPSVLLGSPFAGADLPKPEYAALSARKGDLTIILVPKEFRDEAEWVLESALFDEDPAL